jgi:hypothetical protein
MDYVLFNILVPVLLYVVIISVVDTACFKKDSPSTSVSFNKEGVCSNDSKILLSSIPICVDVVYKKKGLLLVFAKALTC